MQFKFVLILMLSSLLRSTSFAGSGCNILGESSWNWTNEELIHNTEYIIFAKATLAGQRNDYLKSATYVFLPLRTLKGPARTEPFTLRNIETSRGKKEIPRKEEAFIFSNSLGTARLSDKCQLTVADVTIGKSYIVFLKNFDGNGVVLNSRSFERTSGESDPWYRYVLVHVSDVVQPSTRLRGK